MDIPTVFRDLVTNKHMPEFDYAGTSFTFQTVFGFQTTFSYCICECGFQHEYLDYIQQPGGIDEEKYEAVLQCILDGKCPHVSEVPNEFLRETSIYAIHIAVAVGTVDALVDNLQRLPIRYGALYHLDPYAVALLKNNNDMDTMSAVRECFRRKDNYQIKFVSAERSVHEPNSIFLTSEKVLDFLSKTKNDTLLKSYLIEQEEGSIFTCKDDIFRLSLANNLERELGLDKFLETPTFNTLLQNLSENTIWTILYYDKSDVLDTILPSLKNILRVESGILQEIHQMCYVFQSKMCIEVLETHGFGIPAHFEMLQIDIILKLVYLLTNRPQVLKDEIFRLILQTPKVQDNVPLPKLKLYFHCYNRISRIVKDPAVLRKLLDNVSDVNIKMQHDKTPLVDLLNLQCRTLQETNLTISQAVALRQMTEFYIFENPIIDLRDTTVNKAYEVDVQMYKQCTGKQFHMLDFALHGTYRMDGKRHSLIGHDDANDVALDFVVPLLLECGFPLQSNGLQIKLYHQQVHPDEKEYIQRYIRTPRPLKVSCRDVLRKHFQGRNIHEFVRKSKLPRSVCNFLLLRPLLKSIPAGLLR